MGEAGRPGRHFGRILGAIVVLAFVVRVGYIATAKRGPCPAVYGGVVQAQVPSECLGGPGFLNDQYWYSTTADLVSHGHFFDSGPPAHTPLADHPPLQVFVLAATSFAFEHLPLSTLSASPRTVFGARLETHVREQRYTIAIIGTLVVLLVGLLGRRLGGDRVGLFAALLAAVYPNMWVPDGLLFAEPVARLCLLGALLLAVRCRTRARPTTWFALGILCGLTALARQELILLLPLLALPLAWTARDRGARAVVGTLAAIVAGGALVVGPWAAFNIARFHDPVIISTNAGTALAGANCDPGYSGPSIGLWTATPPCLDTAGQEAKLGDESQAEHAYRTRAFHYIEHHERRVPIVLAARIGRTWDLYRPADMVSYSEGENRERAVSWAGLATFYPIALAALAGAVVLWRRRERFTLWLLLVPCLLSTATAVLASGSVRNRAVAEPSLVLLAAVAGVALVEHWRSRRATNP